MTPPETPPKRWTIEYIAYDIGWDVEGEPSDGPIEVVEVEHYDAVVKERDELADTVERYRKANHINFEHDFLPMQKQRDEARAEVEKWKQIIEIRWKPEVERLQEAVKDMELRKGFFKNQHDHLIGKNLWDHVVRLKEALEKFK